MSKLSNTLEEISRNLDSEALSLTEGRIDDFLELSTARQKLVDLLEDAASQDADKETELLVTLRKKAERNNRLTKAALEGLAAANKKIAEIEAACSRLSTYSVNGTVNDVAVKQGRVERKA